MKESKQREQYEMSAINNVSWLAAVERNRCVAWSQNILEHNSAPNIAHGAFVPLTPICACTVAQANERIMPAK